VFSFCLIDIFEYRAPGEMDFPQSSIPQMPLARLRSGLNSSLRTFGGADSCFLSLLTEDFVVLLLPAAERPDADGAPPFFGMASGTQDCHVFSAKRGDGEVKLTSFTHLTKDKCHPKSGNQMFGVSVSCFNW
jgi:hypothetical protein